MGMAAEPQFHVLAVDDSLLDRKLIERLLKISSYQVTTVDSGSKALEFLGFQGDEQSSINQEQPSVSPDSQQVSFSPKRKEVEVNLIITDYCMPGMTGYDLLKKVKESSALRNIPVVIMSSENVPSRINRCLEEGAEEFFLKPVRLSDVNRLRPHMFRAKYGQQKQDLFDECQKPRQQQQPPPPSVGPAPDSVRGGQKSEELQRDQQLPVVGPAVDSVWGGQKPERKTEEQQRIQQEQVVLEQQTEQQNNNKRKSIDGGLSPDRTRPRYNGLTTVV